MNFKPKKQKGQILLISLLVLMVMAVVIIGVVNVLNRDVRQVSSNQKYQQLYSVSENGLLTLAETYGRRNVDLNTLEGSFNECSLSPAPNAIRYICTFEQDTQTPFESTNVVTLSDVKDVSDYELRKDEMLSLNLGGYTEGLNLNWSDDAALELGVIFVEDINANGVWDSNESLILIKDIFDTASVVNSLTSGDPYLSSIFNFTALGGGNDPARSMTFRVRTIDGYQPNYIPTQMYVIKRSLGSADSAMRISVTPTDYGSFPYQTRLINSKAFDLQDPSSPVAELETQIPLTPQTDSLLSYSILSNDIIRLN